MTNILLFPVKNAVPIWGLAKFECDAVEAKAYDLMLEGHATGVSIHYDSQYMCVFDFRGKPYAIGREAGVCYLSAPNKTMLARSRQFVQVLQALEILLRSGPDGAA